ncbi:hypothetical protein AN957_24930 [Cytobacillus solani]|uniref:Uncharacterized protein n=1 Tax=Cytobacillus solani TaxID=1637975 RepID=A0A0Q3QTK2_9BACI|nr:hypothetical protein AMS60_21375 [Bacillus sp. FJAT-21945]KQL21473.1 hypothetical protein AN957_24930 [Cytobacillus solani]
MNTIIIKKKLEIRAIGNGLIAFIIEKTTVRSMANHLNHPLCLSFRQKLAKIPTIFDKSLFKSQ